MSRYIEVGLTKRSVVAVARLLDDEAPETVTAIWDSLPLEGPAFHAKYANNEVYTLLTPFVSPEPALELPPKLREQCRRHGRLIDLAVFYGRNNYLLSPIGHLPGTVFATIEEGLAEFADACNDVWSAGSVGERLTLRRRE